MAELLSKIDPSILVLIAVGGIWAFKEIYTDRKKRGEAQTDALTKCTHAITKLEVQVQNLSEILAILPKLKEDITIAHQKIREISSRRK